VAKVRPPSNRRRPWQLSLGSPASSAAAASAVTACSRRCARHHENRNPVGETPTFQWGEAHAKTKFPVGISPTTRLGEKPPLLSISRVTCRHTCHSNREYPSRCQHFVTYATNGFAREFIKTNVAARAYAQAGYIATTRSSLRYMRLAVAETCSGKATDRGTTEANGGQE